MGVDGRRRRRSLWVVVVWDYEDGEEDGVVWCGVEREIISLCLPR